jgi:hypothetical protein
MTNLTEILNQLDEKYISEANPDKIKKNKRIRYTLIATAVCLALVVCVTVTNTFSFSNSTTVYASELGSNEKVSLNNDYTQIAEYSITQNSIPALCFTIEPKSNATNYIADLTGSGELLKYATEIEDEWNVIENGFSLTYTSNENIYWAPTTTFNDTTITVSIYENNELLDTIEIQIKPSDNSTGYVARVK